MCRKDKGGYSGSQRYYQVDSAVAELEKARKHQKFVDFLQEMAWQAAGEGNEQGFRKFNELLEAAHRSWR